ARRPSDVHSLLIACVHQIAHHQGASKLIWSYDIHLLVERIGRAGLERFGEIAKAAGVSGVCAKALGDAHQLFRTNVAAALMEELNRHSIAAEEPSRGFIDGNTQLGVFLSDFKLIPSWSTRFKLVRQHAFPRP